jgi:hypothetical protein
MLRQARAIAILLLVPAALASCGSPAPTASAKPTARPTPTPTPVPVTTTPTAVPLPPGPYAVVVGNQTRVGSSYDVMLIDTAGQIVARVTAKLPLLKPNQDINLPLVSASNDMVYYLDGDTEIHSLSPSGTVALAKTIAQGAGSILAFSVSPDDRRIAVSLINEAADSTKDSSHGWVEDLTASTNHLDLFDNTGTSSFRWPVGWAGTQIVDGAGYQCGGYGYGYNGPSTNSTACSYHVINSTTTSRTATLCESPSPPPTSENDNLTINGLPVTAGVACIESEYYYNNPTATQNQNTLFAVDWSGHQTTYLTSNTGQLNYGNCYLAPSGAQMACSANTSQALTLLAPKTAPHNLGRRYAVLGWMDNTHIAVETNSTTLGVLSTDTGAVVSLTLTGADTMALAGTLPGAL